MGPQLQGRICEEIISIEILVFLNIFTSTCTMQASRRFKMLTLGVLNCLLNAQDIKYYANKIKLKKSNDHENDL